MTALAPRWALSALAIDAAGDPHLQPGIHLRLFPSQALGLPVMPFVVSRLNLGPAAKGFALRTDITWTDPDGAVLTPPFDVRPDRPVTGWLPIALAGACCWIDLDASPAPLLPRIPLPRLGRPGFEAARRPRLAAGPGMPVVTLPPRPRPGVPPFVPPVIPPFVPPVVPPIVPPVIPRPPKIPPGRLRVDALVGTPRGAAVIASVNQPAYQLGATRIERIVVSGTGTVRGVRWIDARAFPPDRDPWRYLALPHPGGARYAGFADDEIRAADRVARGAPLRFGLHDDPTIPTPSAAPLATLADEADRISALEPPVMEWLKALIDDMSAAAQDLVSSQTVIDENGVTLGSADINCLGGVFNATLDPGMGRWLGFVDRDEAPQTTTPGDVVAYVVRGLWLLDEKRLGTLAGTLPADGKVTKASLPGPDTSGWDASVANGPFLDLWTVAVTTIADPPLGPVAPLLDEPVPGDWLPATPPDAIREIVLPAHGLVGGATVALARREPDLSITGLNRRSSAGRALPLVPAIPAGAVSAGTGEFADRAAPAEAVSYRVAQADLFGRWSGWRERATPAGVRPRPPRPILQAFYTPPGFGTPIPDGDLSGTLDVRTPVPPPDSMAPGSRLLKELELSWTVDGGAATSQVTALPSPSAPATELPSVLTGPPIGRAALRTLSLTGRWRDSADVASDWSDPLVMDLADPRPPVPVVLPNTLAYTSRPDVTGRARAGLRWQAAAGQARFRVFYANETGIRSFLERAVAAGGADGAEAQVALAAADAATSDPDRAAAFVAHAGLLTRPVFEQLTSAPLVADTGGACRFDHALSGSLRVLSFYRIVAVSAGNVESPFADASLVPYAVPNTSPPSQPVITVLPVVDANSGALVAKVTITVPRGLVAAAEYRLRRSVATTETLRMPVVSVAPVEPASGDGPQEVVVFDTGSSELASGGTLAPWTTYTWRAEARGAAEAGGGPPAQWSPPSAAVSTAFLAPAAPLAATDVTAVASGDGFEVSWTHPESLRGGLLGGYTLQLSRRLPDGPEAVIARLAGDAPAALGGRNPDGSGRFHVTDLPSGTLPVPLPADTAYRVTVIDPLGRTSPPAGS